MSGDRMQNVAHGGLGDRSSSKIQRALEGRIDADSLSSAEREIFDDMLGTALAKPGKHERKFFQQLEQEGGSVGYDDGGNLVRGLPGGGVEVIG